MGSQRVGHDWATELNWYIYYKVQKAINRILIAFCCSQWLFSFCLPKLPKFFCVLGFLCTRLHSNLGCRLFSFIVLSMSCHSLLAWRVSIDILMGIPLCVICCFSLAAFNICSLCLIFVNLINMCLGVTCTQILIGTNTYRAYITITYASFKF